MSISPQEVKRFSDMADVTEIEQLFGRYVTLIDRFNAQDVYEELFAKNDDTVSVEYENGGKYIGKEHVRTYWEYQHKLLQNYTDKRGWLNFIDAGTPHAVISDDGKKAAATWALISPKAKFATPDGEGGRTLAQFWHGGKMYWELIKEDSKWKILHFRLVTYFTAPYDKGWVEQAECFREEPFWALRPDEKPRFNVYHPDKVYIKDGAYNWGPYLPDIKDL